MKPTAERLGELLCKPVIMASDVIGEDAKAKAAALKDGEVLMLENVRFHKEEEKNNPEFAKELSTLAEIYVNDAFGTAHRAHASTAGLADYSSGGVRFPYQQGNRHNGQSSFQSCKTFCSRYSAVPRFRTRYWSLKIS